MGDKFTVYVNFKLWVPSVCFFLFFHCLLKNMFGGSIKVFSKKGFVSVCHLKGGIVRTGLTVTIYWLIKISILLAAGDNKISPERNEIKQCFG